MIRYTLKIDATDTREYYSNIVFTAGDKRGYRLDFSFFNGKEKMVTENCMLIVKAKRADGAVVIDSGVINKEECYWVAADNVYGVCGALEIEVALSKTDGTLATTCVIFATVREGFGETGVASSDNEPILAKLSAQSLSAQAAVNAHKTDEEAHAELFAKERESSNLLYATALSDHKTDEEAHAELFEKERESSNLLYATALSDHKADEEAHAELFAKERESSNLLYATALIDEAEHNTELLVSDVVDTTPIALSIYGSCTETLSEGVTEKSLENPAIITGVGESGSVIVTLTDGKGEETEIEIPLDAPLYGICHPQTGEWLARDEIRVESGKVTLIRNITSAQVTEKTTCTAGRVDAERTFVYLLPVGDRGTPLIPTIPNASSVLKFAVVSPQLKTGSSVNHPQNLALGCTGSYAKYAKLAFSNSGIGITDDMTAEERKTAFQNWLSAYNAESSVPLMLYFFTTPTETDITDTDAGKLLLSLSASGNMSVKTNENSPVGMRYHRELSSAYRELKNAIVAMGGVI